MSQAVLLDINPPEQHARAMAIWVMGVTIGPILGPALGGWLTENYNWRWVFYINVPFGILVVPRHPAASCRRRRSRKSRFDFFGFAALSLAIGAFQLMLDRGQLKDWFSSTEIWVEAIVAGLAFYLFIVHMLTTTRAPFVSPALFKDRNFLTGNVFIFVVGVVLFATLALLPPLLQDLMDYPVVLTGLVTAPRGVGTLVADVHRRPADGQGRHPPHHRRRLRADRVVALADDAASTCRWTAASMVWSGLVQGLGTGFVYVPLAAVTFATLSPRCRNEGTAVFSLIRNIGSSIGISVVDDAADAQYADDAFAPRRARHAVSATVLHLHAPPTLRRAAASRCSTPT